MAMMLTVMAIDFIILGTRNAPAFVLLFHLLMIRGRILSLRTVAIGVICIILFVMLFDYQSRSRSLDSITTGWDWSATLRYSWLMDNLRVSDATIDTLKEFFPAGLPAVFLVQYITHSIATLSKLLFAGQFDAFPQPYYLYDQICIALSCDREYLHTQIQAINPESGLYQTLYGSLLFDFGWAGLLLIYMVITLLYCLIRGKKQIISALSIYLAVILTISGVENYFYNGLGLLRFIAFICLIQLLSLPFDTTSPTSKKRSLQREEI